MMKKGGHTINLSLQPKLTFLCPQIVSNARKVEEITLKLDLPTATTTASLLLITTSISASTTGVSCLWSVLKGPQ